MLYTRIADDYVADPVGKCFVGSCFLHFFDRPDSCGTVFFDGPDTDAILTFIRAVHAELPSHSPPHTSFCDTRRLTRVDEGAFGALVAGLDPLHAALGPNVTRQALIRPQGTLGALVAGFYEVSPAAYPDRLRIFEDAMEGLRFLRHPDPGYLLATLDEARAAACGAPAIVTVVREYVERHPRATIAEAAAVVGVTRRVLQDRLKDAGTSFRREVNAARVRVAQRLLETTDTKLTAIALDVGCASLPHFSALFRKGTGEAPSAWRAKRRTGT